MDRNFITAGHGGTMMGAKRVEASVQAFKVFGQSSAINDAHAMYMPLDLPPTIIMTILCELSWYSAVTYRTRCGRCIASNLECPKAPQQGTWQAFLLG